ncbi:MAG: GtrA family protein [Kiritimatiellia bacterium]
MSDPPQEKIPFPTTFGELWRQLRGGGAAAHPLIQFFKYGLVGGLATGVDMAVFFLSAWFIFPALTETDIFVRLFAAFGVTVPVVEIDQALRANHQFYDNVIAFSFSNTFCYIVNALWVFQPGRHSRVKEFALFFAASGISSGAGILVADILVRFAGMQTSVSYIAKVIASVLINYVARKKIVFKG